MDDLVYNDGKSWWMRLKNIYYQRVIGKGWLTVDESALPADIRWSAMHEKQREIYSKQIEREG